jgi:hypothetical protein
MIPVIPCEIAEKFPVVMLYDHFSSVGVAMATYTYLTHELGSEFKPELRVWRMDAATSAEYSVAANNDIAAAEVILMTIRGNQPWPAAFKHWITGENEPGALFPHAVISLITAEDGPSADEGEGIWSAALSTVATQIHPGVFVWEKKPD